MCGNSCFDEAAQKYDHRPNMNEVMRRVAFKAVCVPLLWVIVLPVGRVGGAPIGLALQTREVFGDA